MFGWERNPLRRRIDRVEGGLVAALIVVFLIATPLLTVVAGHCVYGAGLRQEHAAAAAWRQIPAPVQRGAAQETYSGSLTRPPSRRAPLGAQAALGEVLVASGLIALFVLLTCAGQCLASQRRFNDWDRAWLDVAPQWTKRL